MSKKSDVKVSAKRKIKKLKKVIVKGNFYIKASFNNTLIYSTDLDGNVLGWATSGSHGFKGSRKSTPYAAQMAAKHIAQNIRDKYKMISVDVYIKGPGPGRESAIRGLSDFFNIVSISDVTGIPHNGCRPQKERRV